MNGVGSRSFSLFSVFVLIVAAGWIFFSRVPAGSTTGGGIPAPQKDFLSPDFSLQDSSGEVVQLASLRGRPVVINFWASWCPPCRAEMPALENVYQEFHAQGLEILAVNATAQDDAQLAAAFAQDNQLTFPILYDFDGSVSALYATRALPTSFFVDAQGIIREVVVGGPMSEALLRVRVEQLFQRSPVQMEAP